MRLTAGPCGHRVTGHRGTLTPVCHCLSHRDWDWDWDWDWDQGLDWDWDRDLNGDRDWDGDRDWNWDQDWDRDRRFSTATSSVARGPAM